MLWRDIFSKEPGETNKEALERCYPKLIIARQRLYERNADVEIDYYTRREEGFGVSDFLHLRQFQNVSRLQRDSRSRKAKILTTGIH